MRRALIVLALVAVALFVVLDAPLDGLAAQTEQITVIEAQNPDEVALAARLDDDLSTLATAVAACAQDGGAPPVCLCAARPALIALVGLAETIMEERPRWAARGAVVTWRGGLAWRSLSIPGVRLEAARTLAVCQG